jgi:hypothetical protein
MRLPPRQRKRLPRASETAVDLVYADLVPRGIVSAKQAAAIARWLALAAEVIPPMLVADVLGDAQNLLAGVSLATR